MKISLLRSIGARVYHLLITLTAIALLSRISLEYRNYLLWTNQKLT